MYHRFGKRFLDIALAGITLILLSPVMLLTALAIRIEDGAPALFRQKRVGRNGQLFEFLKFRSMPISSGNVPSNEARSLRVTKVGMVIRRTNIDELPQLINILRGDMSIVGPRPALPVQTRLCELRKVNGSLSSTPGLTGLAQVNSYDNMSETEKARWDLSYTSKISFTRDLGIILRTFRYLAGRPPVY